MRDIVGTNGILHVLEEVLVPATARTVDQALEDEGADTMAELFRLADFDLETLSNVTVFAPSEKALKDMPRKAENSTFYRNCNKGNFSLNSCAHD